MSVPGRRVGCKWRGDARASQVLIHSDRAYRVQVRRAYKFLLRPTSKQAALLEMALEDHRQRLAGPVLSWRWIFVISALALAAEDAIAGVLVIVPRRSAAMPGRQAAPVPSTGDKSG